MSTPPVLMGTVQCDECSGVHEAEYSHDGRFGEGPVYVVVCGGFTDYYTFERVTPKAPPPECEHERTYVPYVGSVCPKCGRVECCDGTGWTGDSRRPCGVHFVLSDPAYGALR